MIKRFLRKWLGVETQHERINDVWFSIFDMRGQIQNLQIEKQNKPQNCKPPVRAAVKRKAKGRK